MAKQAFWGLLGQPHRTNIPEMAMGTDARGVEERVEGFPLAQDVPECKTVM